MSLFRTPFKLRGPYGKKARHNLLGRPDQVEQLYRLVFQSNLTLVYGKAGTGKTRLVREGLAGRFAPADWLDIYVLRGGNINDSLLRALEQKEQTAPGNSLLEERLRQRRALRGRLSDDAPAVEEEVAVASPVIRRLRAIYELYFKPVYLIFDQLEELFIESKQQEQEQEQERKLFFETLAGILATETYCRIILVMREEWLAALHDYEYILPILFDKRLRLRPAPLVPVAQPDNSKDEGGPARVVPKAVLPIVAIVAILAVVMLLNSPCGPIPPIVTPEAHQLDLTYREQAGALQVNIGGTQPPFQLFLHQHDTSRGQQTVLLPPGDSVALDIITYGISPGDTLFALDCEDSAAYRVIELLLPPRLTGRWNAVDDQLDLEVSGQYPPFKLTVRPKGKTQEYENSIAAAGRLQIARRWLNPVDQGDSLHIRITDRNGKVASTAVRIPPVVKEYDGRNDRISEATSGGTGKPLRSTSDSTKKLPTPTKPKKLFQFYPANGAFYEYKAAAGQGAFLEDVRNQNGFTIQLSAFREEANFTAYATTVRAQHPVEPIFFSYKAPYSRIYLGFFDTRPEAEQFLQKLEPLGPSERKEQYQIRQVGPSGID